VNAVAIIPAREGSRRLPGKPLVPLIDKPLIQWVHQAVAGSGLFEHVVVATDSDRVASTVDRFGGDVEMTRRDHRSGTLRIAEVAARRGYEQIIANIQGDQPFTSRECLVSLLSPFAAARDVVMTTVAAPLTPTIAASDPDVVKVVCDLAGRAMYFSRAVVPWGRTNDVFLRHVGMYAFTSAFLDTYAGLPAGPLEISEDLEQLRALEHGYPIRVGRVSEAPVEVNTPADLSRAEAAVAQLRARQ
jgi:3-deoxy-manno-octulosonate cytidylyltransferase (CMP-KDO synthetase)